MLRSIFLATISFATWAGCDPYDPDLGPTPFRCGANEPTCPEGYSCNDEVCTRTSSSGVDAASNAFACADDSSVEGRPSGNDMIAGAFVTPISSVTSYSLGRLAICPGTDKDHYKIEINANATSLSASVTSVAGRTPLSLKLVNMSGLEFSGAPVPGSPQRVALDLDTLLAAGDYFVQVQSQDSTENNYSLSIKVCLQSLPCP